MKCPICQEHNLVTQSLEDCGDVEPDVFCPKGIVLKNGKVYNHYRKFGSGKYTRIIVLPYRIMTNYKMDIAGNTICYSQISKLSNTFQYKSGGPYFKTVIKNLPEIRPTTEENLINRIKMCIVMS